MLQVFWKEVKKVMSDELKVINSDHPLCRHLLSKGMYINLDLPADQHVAGDGYLWCQKTMEAMGPDSDMVERARCIPGRTCYENMV